MAYYAALVSLVELLKEMSHSEHQYPKSYFEKQQIIRFYETSSQLQELLEDYSPNNNKEAAGFLDRIRDAACLAQDLIECPIPDEACQAREIIEGRLPNSTFGEGEVVECQLLTRGIFESQIPNAAYRAERIDIFYIPHAIYRAQNIIESEISDQIRGTNCLAEIIHVAFRLFVSACHNPENANEEIDFTIRKGYRDLLKLTKQLGSIFSKGCRDLTRLVNEVDSIGKGYLDLVKLKEKLDSVVLKGYQDLLKLKEELDHACEGKGYQDSRRVKEVVYSIVGRGNQDLDRVKEEVDVIVGKGYTYVLGKIEEVVDSLVKSGYEDIERMKEEVDSILGRGYQERKRQKEELDSVDSFVVKGYQDLVKLKKELGAVAQMGHENMKKVKQEVDSIVGRGYQELERMEDDVDSVVEKIYKDLGKEVVGSTLGRGYQVLERVKEEICSIMGKGYHDWDRVKREVDSLVIKGYQDLVKLKEEIGAIARMGNQNRKKVKEVVDSIVGRGYQDLGRVKEEVDITVENGYKDIFDNLKEEVDSIVEDLKGMDENHTTHQDDLKVSVGASTQGISDGTRMVGFEEHLISMLGQLCGESSRLEVISIVGMGGIGKTTLARNTFYDKLIDDQFYFRIWVTVSQSYNLRNILLAIAKSLNLDDEELHGVEDAVLKKRVYQHLFGRRFLIVMDDVWDTKIWDDVKWIFPNDNKSRSRIILTTRQSDVASLASASEFNNKIPVLEYDRSWDLFRDKVFCPPELEDIGRLIVKKCGGLPLAVVVVAGLLSNVNTTRSDWEKIAKDMSSTAAKNDEHFTKILSLSYNYLPHHLKPCFLYFGGFPEDYEISVSKLIKLWVAEGFLKSVASKSLEEVDEEYLEELVKRNLVLITKRKSNGKFGHCSIHDLLKDLCSERARHEHFLLLLHKHIDTGHIHRFFIHPDSSSDISMLERGFRHVHSILSFGNMASHYSSRPSNFKPLRVLEGPHIDLCFSPDGVFELLHLRYLLLLHSRSRFIPSSIFKLQNLQTLIVVSSFGETFTLPSEIWKMPQLRHVMINQVRLPPIPRGARITSEGPLLGMLQTLYKVVDFSFNRNTVAMIPNLKKLKLGPLYFNRRENCLAKYGLKSLVDLHQLETLDIYFDQRYSSGKEHDVIPFPVRFSFPLNLKKLSLRGCILPWKDLTIVGSLPNLLVLKLRWDSFVGREWEPIEGEFPKLKYLLLEGLYDLEYWGAENSHFPCLEQLHIRNCKKLEIPSGVGDIPTLQLIELHYCSSYVESRALEIQQEQQEFGNDGLQVRCIR